MTFYDRLMDRVARSKPGGWIVLNVTTPLDKKLMRWTNGRLSSASGSKFHKNMLLLTSTGAKSGLERDTPLVFARTDDGGIILIASRTGHAKNPAWYYNLKKNPECVVRFGGKKLFCTARIVKGDERDAAWAAATRIYPGYDDYKARTDRVIPVLVLRPR